MGAIKPELLAPDGARSRIWRALAIRAARVRADVAFSVTDALIVIAGYVVALSIRMLDSGVAERFWGELRIYLPLLVILHVGGNVLTGAYGHVWEHASIAEARQVLTANLGVLAVMLTIVAVQDPHPIPLSTVILGTGITTGGMGLVRFRSRMFSYRRLTETARRPRAVIVGTNRAAATFAREASEALDVVGFVTTDGVGNERWLAGLPIIGDLSTLKEDIDGLGIEQVVVVGAKDDLIRSVVDHCIDIDVRLRILPDPGALLTERQAAVDVRDIELHDLLPRPIVHTDMDSVRSLLAGKRVLVTGGGGSIGSELVRQVCQYAPAVVFALDRDETLLHELTLSLGNATRLVEPVLADLRDAQYIESLMKELRPQIVFHAGALKHVPVLEEYPIEAHKTNVRGTVNLLEALRDTELERFVMVSTDKAVRPTSVMGASKRVAEMIVQQESQRSKTAIYTSVRFGNVLGSRGSVVPTFVKQIQVGGPVTITDAEMTRYFMTVSEAVELVLQSAALAEGGEVFVLDMGEPVRIKDLARRLIRLAGLVPGRDIQIVETGVRPGEKLAESLAHGELEPTGHPKIRVTRPPSPGPVTMYDFVYLLDSLAEARDHRGVKEGLRDLATHEWDGFEVITLDDTDPVRFQT